MTENLKQEVLLLVTIIVGIPIFAWLFYTAIITYPYFSPQALAVHEPIEAIHEGKKVKCAWYTKTSCGYTLDWCDNNIQFVCINLEAKK
jgi:uncharacterized membrane protein (DUF106 family)